MCTTREAVARHQATHTPTLANLAPQPRARTHAHPQPARAMVVDVQAGVGGKLKTRKVGLAAARIHARAHAHAHASGCEAAMGFQAGGIGAGCKRACAYAASTHAHTCAHAAKSHNQRTRWVVECLPACKCTLSSEGVGANAAAVSVCLRVARTGVCRNGQQAPRGEDSAHALRGGLCLNPHPRTGHWVVCCAVVLSTGPSRSRTAPSALHQAPLPRPAHLPHQPTPFLSMPTTTAGRVQAPQGDGVRQGDGAPRGQAALEREDEPQADPRVRQDVSAGCGWGALWGWGGVGRGCRCLSASLPAHCTPSRPDAASQVHREQDRHPQHHCLHAVQRRERAVEDGRVAQCRGALYHQCTCKDEQFCDSLTLFSDRVKNCVRTLEPHLMLERRRCKSSKRRR